LLQAINQLPFAFFPPSQNLKLLRLSKTPPIMSSSQAYYYPTTSMPIATPRKPGYYPSPHHAAYSRMSVSPPEAADSVTTSGVASYDPSATSSSYAGSASEYDSASSGPQSVDLYEYMNDRVASAYNPMPLDRSLAQQAQT